MRISDWSSDVCSSDLRRKAGSHHDLRAGIFAAAGPLGPTLGAVGLRALALALEKNMNSIGIPATAAMPPSKRYVVRQPKSSNRKTVSSGTNDEAIPVEQSVTARDRPRLALKRLVTAAIQTVGLMNRLALARNVHNAHHVHMGCCASDRNATPDA